MIALHTDPPRFDRPADISRHALAAIVADACRAEGMKVSIRVRAIRAPNPRREIRNVGMVKVCEACATEFRVTQRGDCRSRKCPACRALRPARPSFVSRVCAVKGCAGTFRTCRASVIHCERHRLLNGQNRKSIGTPATPKPPVPAAMRERRSLLRAAPVPASTHCSCGARLDYAGRCDECSPLAVWK